MEKNTPLRMLYQIVPAPIIIQFNMKESFILISCILNYTLR